MITLGGRGLVISFGVLYAAGLFASTPISTTQEFLDQVVANPTGDYVLTADLAFDPKLAAIPEFSGTLDGDGKTITGVSSNLVGSLTGTIKNLTIADSDYQHKRITYSSCSPFGFFAVSVNGGEISKCTLRNCTLTRDKYASADAGVGGIAGNIGESGGTISGCYVIGCSIGTILTSETMTIGGVLGRSFAAAEGTALVSDCHVLSVDAATSEIKGNLVGGVVGGVAINCFLRIERCSFDATISGGSNLGGILGPCTGGNVDVSVVDVVDCTNAANISVSCAAGGIVAGSYKGGLFRISGCVNRGNIATTVNNTEFSKAANGTGTGGIMGGLYAQATVAGVVLDRCANYGTISAEGNCTGGLVGFLHKGNCTPFLIISNSVNHADISSAYYTGGLVGYDSFSATGDVLVNCCQTGSVVGNGSMPVGGLIGCVKGGSKYSYRFSNVCQSGTVTSTSGPASPVFGELTMSDKTYFKVFFDGFQIGGSATSESGTTGIISGSTVVGTSPGPLTVTVDDASRFAVTTGTAYYDQTGAAQELTLTQLPTNAMADGTVVAALNSYAEANGLVSWVQGKKCPDLSIFFSAPHNTGLRLIVR